MISPHRSLQRRTSNRTVRPIALRALPQPSILSLLVSTLFLPLPTLCPLPAHAQVIADPTAGPHERPVIHSTASGLPQVDITAPTAAGVSVNRFTQFDIDPAGAIVNNGRTASRTSLAGWVAANPALLASPARVIVGEVRGPLPSQLHGFVEIAGSKADFILANPAGITCNGCGFINAQRIELATGTPQWQAHPAGAPASPGTLPGHILGHIPGGPPAYVLGPGSFTVEGAGMDARSTRAASILTQAAQINAMLWADHLQLMLAPASGPDDGRSASPAMPATSPASPSFALDVAALGGIAAHSIYLVGTADGLGARNLGTVAASERLVVTLDGKLVNEGTLDARQLTVAATDIDNLAHGRMLGEQVAVSTGRLANAGHPDAAPVIAAADRLDIGARVLENTDGAILFSGGELAIGGALDAAGHATGQADTVLNRAATIEALGGLQIASRQLYNVNGGVVIDEQPLGPPTQHALLQPAGSSERHDLSRFRFEPWSRAGQYRWITDADRIDDGVLGATPIEPLADETCVGEGEAEVCTPVRGASYPADDPAWAYFGLTPPDAAPPPPGPAPSAPDLRPPAPLPEGLPADDPARAAHAQQQADYDRFWADYHQQLAEHERATAAWTAWEAAADTRRQALGDAIARYNASFNAQLIRSWTQYHVTRTSFESVVTASSPARIVAGGDLTLTGDDLVNDRSQIVAGGRLAGTLANLTQIDALGTHRVSETGTSQYSASRWRGGFRRYHQRDWGPVLPYAPADQVTTIVLPVTVTGERAAPGSQGAPAVDVAVQRLTTDGSALWQVSPAPGSGPVFVTDPRFTRYRDWISSDLMLAQLQLDPATVMPRLGDGFIEQRLVREQVAQLSGRRWLPGHGDDDAQYAALLASGVHHAQALQLRPGIALSPEQVAQLTSDLVWLVERDVTLPDGRTQRVLVPQVYLRPREGDLAGDGTLMAGQTVDWLVREAVRSAGTIAAQGGLRIDAGQIQHTGTWAGASVDARARTDLAVQGGSVSAQDTATLAAGQDLVLQSTTTTTERTVRPRGTSPMARFVSGARGSTAQRTQLDRVAQVQVGGAGPGSGELQLVAGRDVVMNAAAITQSGPGSTVIAAGRDLQLGTVTTEARVAAQGRDARNFLHEHERTDRGTRIDVQGDVLLAAGQDATLMAATVRSETGALVLEAGRDVTLTAGEQTREQAQGTYVKRSSTFGSTRTTTRSEAARTDVLGSELGAATITINAARDASVTGSTVVADGHLQVTAGQALTLDAATASTHQSDYRQTTRSGLMGSGGMGVTVGRQRITGESVTTTTTDVGSTVGSLAGNVTLAAGTILTQTASSVLAPQGDIVMTGPTVTVEAGTRHATMTQRMETKQTGLTVAVSNPVIAAAQTAQQMSQAASRTSDPRMQALAAANTALATAEAAQAVKIGQGATINGQPNQIATGTDAAGKTTSRDATGLDKLGGLQVSVSVGSSRSSSQTVTTTTDAVASKVAAGGDVTIAALAPVGHRGSSAASAAEGDLTVRGSTVAAGDTARLVATSNLVLEAAANTQEQQSTNRASSASVGVTMSTQQKGFGVTVSGSRGRGHADGQGQTWSETTVDARHQVQLASGADTTLAGALVTAPQVTAAIGGDLAITSLQDTETYTSRQKQTGGSVTIGAAPSANVNAAGSRIDSSYASVNEVSGIQAGDGGFNVTVQGNATLSGAVIASTDAAVEVGRNQVAVGGTTTTTDIANAAQFEASGYGVSVGAGYSAKGQWVPGGSGVGVGSDGDQASSVTRSGISGIAGDTSVRSQDAHAPLARIFDAQRVQGEINAQVQITQTFSTLAPRAVATYADGQIKAIGEQLQHEQDEVRRAELLAEQQRWGEGGSYRVMLHTAAGGLGGGVAGAAGAGVAATAAPVLNDWQATMTSALTKVGMNPELAEGVAAQVTGLAAAGLGAAAGGPAGAGTAWAADANNRQLHPDERQFIDKKSKEMAVSSCKSGDSACMEAAKRYWKDQLTAEAEALDDSKLSQKRQEYLKQVASTANASGQEGQVSGAAGKYLQDAQAARDALDELRGKPILGSDGKQIIADGAPLKYFSGTEAQRNDHTLYLNRPGPYDRRVSDNGSAANVVLTPDLLERAQRDGDRLERMSAASGAAEPDFTIEEVLVGGGAQIGKVVAKTIGKSIAAKAETASAEVTSSSAAKLGATARGQGTPDALQPEADFAGRSTVREDLADHLINPKLHGKQISGGHDINEFNTALSKAGGTVVSKIEMGPGIYEIHYQLPNTTKLAVKTVFDPARYPNMESMANTAANKALLEYQRTGNAAPVVQVNGVVFDVRIAVRQGQPPSVRTAFPVGVSK